ncbi:MAG: FtsQ-type POTRA domain-containing protein, partial [Alphaproteobacteria bacterium]|nr:FtsQ-type POTRA domain-containing protein [Alphaproteobacteria bacterium]
MIMIVMALGYLYYDPIMTFYHSIQNGFKSTSVKIGFRIDKLAIHGKDKTPDHILNQAIGLRKGDYIFENDLTIIKNNLEKVDWIKSARIKRTLPNIIDIYIQERQPIALWKHKKEYYLVDEEGVAIQINSLEPYRSLPLISGDGAAQSIEKTLEIVEKFPCIRKVIKSFIRIRHRRWDMIIFQTFIVKLPDDMNDFRQLEHALKKLDTLIQQNKITPKMHG